MPRCAWGNWLRGLLAGVMALGYGAEGFQENPEAPRLVLIFAAVYCTQGMWYLPDPALTLLISAIFPMISFGMGVWTVCASLCMWQTGA